MDIADITGVFRTGRTLAEFLDLGGISNLACALNSQDGETFKRTVTSVSTVSRLNNVVLAKIIIAFPQLQALKLDSNGTGKRANLSDDDQTSLAFCFLNRALSPHPANLLKLSFFRDCLAGSFEMLSNLRALKSLDIYGDVIDCRGAFEMLPSMSWAGQILVLALMDITVAGSLKKWGCRATFLIVPSRTNNQATSRSWRCALPSCRSTSTTARGSLVRNFPATFHEGVTSPPLTAFSANLASGNIAVLEHCKHLEFVHLFNTNVHGEEVS